MRPIVSKQSSHQFPLNQLFGAQSHVRILRALAASGDPLSSGNIAQRAKLTSPGARKALTNLVQTGMVTQTGSGKQQKYALRRNESLVTDVLQLFETERQRSADLLEALRHAIQQLSPSPIRAWTPGFPTHLADSWKVVLVHSTRELAKVVRDLQLHVARVEQRFGVTVQITGFIESDQPKFHADQVLLLTGSTPDQPICKLKSLPVDCSGSDLECSTLEFSTALAKLIERDPSLKKRARLHIEQMLAKDGDPANHDLREWLDILRTYPPTRLAQFLTSSSERTRRLISSNPFSAILGSNEREYLLGASQADA